MAITSREGILKVSVIISYHYKYSPVPFGTGL